jgi:hypothetical protein
MSVIVLQPLEATMVAPSAQSCENRFISNGIGYATFCGRSHDAVIRRVYAAAGNMVETHEHRGGTRQRQISSKTLAISQSGEFTVFSGHSAKRGLPLCSVLTHYSLYGARNGLQDAM